MKWRAIVRLLIVVGAIRRLGWAYVPPCLVTGTAVVGVVGLFKAILQIPDPFGQAVAFWASLYRNPGNGVDGVDRVDGHGLIEQIRIVHGLPDQAPLRRHLGHEWLAEKRQRASPRDADRPLEKQRCSAVKGRSEPDEAQDETRRARDVVRQLCRAVAVSRLRQARRTDRILFGSMRTRRALPDMDMSQRENDSLRDWEAHTRIVRRCGCEITCWSACCSTPPGNAPNCCLKVGISPLHPLQCAAACTGQQRQREERSPRLAFGF